MVEKVSRAREGKLIGNRWVVVTGKQCQRSHSNRICKTIQSVANGHFYKHFSLILASSFRYQPSVAVSGNLGGKVPSVEDVLSSNEQRIYPTTSLDENYLEFELKTDRNNYVDLRQMYLVLKLKIVKGRGYENLNSKELKKERKEDTKADEEKVEEEQETPFLLVTHVNIILYSIFPIVEVYINNQQVDNSNGMYAHKSYYRNNFKAVISDTRGCCTARVKTMNIFHLRLRKHLGLNSFLRGE